MFKLEFYNPSGVIEAEKSHAPRLPPLAGRRIGFITNDQWQAYRTFPLLKSLLEQSFPGVEVLPLETFPQGNARIGEEETALAVKRSGVDAVIIGNAA